MTTGIVTKGAFKSFFKEVDTMAKEKPLATITYAFALTIFAGFIAPFSLIIAIGVFSISLPFHLLIIKNFKSICHNLAEKTKDIFTGDPREKGQIAGRNLKILGYQIYARTRGFFEGLFSKSKEPIV
ncbi:MAG: hypothetical protein KR126chlam5_00257 [Candidatus Anoxychlamydiales bacterium]|nr:hypothetical protein [Candidatus Anoxychlamydiales bacterium]